MVDKKQLLGGQALIEGVMIKGKDRITAAVRRPNGQIVTKKDDYKAWTGRNWFLKLPIIRGATLMLEMVVIGTKALSWSANQATDGEEEELKPWQMGLTIALSFLLALALFVGLPYWLSSLLRDTPDVIFNLWDGLFRVIILVLYMYLISLGKEMQKIFQYHGAEHMAVYCHENDLRLTVKNVKKYPPQHPRCGTSFIVFVLLVSIFVFSFLKSPVWYINVTERILVTPIIAGLSYELLRWSAKQRHKAFKVLTYPGIWLQYITTKKPTDKQIEVAIAALKKAL